MLKEVAAAFRDEITGTVKQIEHHPILSKYLNEKNEKNTYKYQQLNEKVELVKEISNKLVRSEFVIGIAGDQSSGKSVLLNSLLKYPILPVANVVTSSAAVRIKFSSKPYVNIFLDQKFVKNIPLSLHKDIFVQLKKYFCRCQKGIGLENIKYFTSADVDSYALNDKCLEHDMLEMQISNEQHVATLLITLFGAYIDQNAQEDTIDKETEELIKFREQLYKGFGLNPMADYMVDLGWNADILSSGLVLIDLPGLGAAVQTKQDGKDALKSHDQLTMDAIKTTDAIVLVVPETGPKSETDKILPLVIQNAKFMHSHKKDNRIIVVANKIDRAMNTGGPASVNALIGKIITKLKQYGLDNAEIHKCAALPASEYLYVESMNLPIERTSEYKTALYNGDDYSEAAIKAKLSRKYENISGHKILNDFICEYMIRSIVFGSCDLVYHLHDLERILSSVIDQKLAVNIAMLDTIDEANDKLLVYLDDLLKELSVNITVRIRNIVNEKMDQINTEIDRRNSNSGIDIGDQAKLDICNSKNTLINEVQKLNNNFLGDIILRDKKGNGMPELTTLNAAVFNFKQSTFNITFTKLTKSMNEVISYMEQEIEKLDRELAQIYRTLKSLFTVKWTDTKRTLGELPEKYLSFLTQMGQIITTILSEGDDIDHTLSRIAISEVEKSNLKRSILNQMDEIRRNVNNSLEELTNESKTNSWLNKEYINKSSYTQSIMNEIEEDVFSQKIRFECVEALGGELNNFFLKNKIKKGDLSRSLLDNMMDACMNALNDARVAYGAGKATVMVRIENLVDELNDITQEVDKLGGFVTEKKELLNSDEGAWSKPLSIDLQKLNISNIIEQNEKTIAYANKIRTANAQF